MSKVIPLKDNANYKFSIQLDSKTYILQFLYNTVNTYWTFSISDENETLLLSNIKIVKNFPLTDKYKIEGLPAGDFMCASTTDRITRDSFKNKEATLIYMTEAEIEAIQ